MYLSIVTTTFNSEQTIDEFFKKVRLTLSELKILKSEIIIVDDGSNDKTIQKLKTIKENNQNLTVISLSKNYGHHKALMTGLKEAVGDFIFLIDSDLEENPSFLKNFFDVIKDYDFVYGIQKKRSAGLITNFLGNAFYNFFNLISYNKIPNNLTTMTLMRKKVMKELTKFNENEVFFHGLLHTIGFTKKEILIEKVFKGSSEYTFAKKIELFFDAITAFSSIPLKLFFYFGFVITLFSSLYAFYILFAYFTLKITVPGFTTLLILILFFGGVITLGIGILGIYIHRIFLEVKKRPIVTIKDKF